MKIKSRVRKITGRAKRKERRPSPARSPRSSPSSQSAASIPLSHRHSSRRHCLKCDGWIVVQTIDLSKKVEMRCLNCGWQPQYGERIIKETEDAQAIRRFTARVFSETESSSFPHQEEDIFRTDFPKSKRAR